MAEGILFDIAARIIESLGSRALKEIGLLRGVTDELQKLESTVSKLKAVLLDAEEKGAVNNHEVNDWLEKLKDGLYDADDLLDGFSTECLLREMMTRDKMAKKVRIFFSKSNQLVYDLKMGPKIKAIRQKLDALDNDRAKFNFKERREERGVRASKRDDNDSGVPVNVTGREDDKKKIIDILLSDSNVKENVGILPITGIGGLGKTTLAQLIFNDQTIQTYFQLKMWACVSDIFDVKKIVEKVLESVTNEEQEVASMEALASRIRKEIEGKKYLLVLDDVWNEDSEKWDKLKKLLMGGARGSRILVTTRNDRVANLTRTDTVEPYHLRGLNKEDSWSLFKQMAFRNGQEPRNSRIEAIGKDIVEKCSGVPLAIRTIGRTLLCLENSEAEWVSFNNNKLQKIKEDKIIIPTLKLSYDQLPSHLKQCFAYCSIFPKDYVMKKSKLIHLWIAQGFIKQSNQNECLEDVGHEYFMDLLWRSFFQEAEVDHLGNMSTCKMHDLMHDLAMSVAGSLITRLESKEKIISDQKTRHISIVKNIDLSCVIPTSSSKASRIRTLLSLSESEDLQESSTSCEAIFSSLKFLRVLDLHERLLDLVPSSICKLKHLRDLDLSWNLKIKKLPDSITRLQNLYTLRLSRCYNLEELPRGITKLVNLRHLYNDGCTKLTYMPRGLGELKNLQTLSMFVVHSDSASKYSCRLSELNRLNSLRGELKISGLRLGEEDVTLNVKEKEHIQVLTLSWTRSRENVINARDQEMALEGFEPHPNLKKLYVSNYGGVRVPMSLTNLVELKLWFCSKLKYLPPLSRLPFLKSISLGCLDEIEYVSDCSDNNELSSFSSSAFFPSLETIYFNGCGNLKGWWRRSDSYNVDVNTTGNALLFPRLSYLKIWGCPMLTSLPMFPHLEKELVLINSRWKAVQQTITNASSSASSTPIAFSSAPLSKLKIIFLREIEDLETLPEDVLQNLISLQRLQIYHCPKLKSLSQGVQYLTALQNLVLIECSMLDLGNDEHGMQWKGLKSLISLKFKSIPKLVSLPLGLQHVTTLQELRISNCPMLDLGNDEHGMQWKGLKSLTSLKFKSIPKLVSLPLGLQHVTTLRELQISDCSSLMTIPEWICNWASLERFTISTCSGLTSLPEAMSRLISLKELTIDDCPILFQRCQQDRGEDWPKIAHIPKRYFES